MLRRRERARQERGICRSGNYSGGEGVWASSVEEIGKARVGKLLEWGEMGKSAVVKPQRGVVSENKVDAWATTAVYVQWAKAIAAVSK